MLDSLYKMVDTAGNFVGENWNSLFQKMPSNMSLEISSKGIGFSSKANYLTGVTPLYLSLIQAGVSVLGVLSGRDAFLPTLGGCIAAAYIYDITTRSKNFKESAELNGKRLTGKELMLKSLEINIATSAISLCLFINGERTLPAVCSTGVLGVAMYLYGQEKGEIFGIKL